MMAESKVICVLGMHRSGTSLLTRLLNLLGVYLGPEDHLLKPGTSNPKGFWEHEHIARLNEEILSRLGGSWFEPPVFPPRWETADALEDLRQRAAFIIERDFAGAALWGWKDPRTCLTLPFWQRLVPQMLYVSCLRTPLDVAHSLYKRNGMPLEQGLRLWLLYTKAALEHTSGRMHIAAGYEDILSDWPREVDRLARFLGLSEVAAGKEVCGGIRDFIDRKLQHHRHPAATDGEANEDLPTTRALRLAQQAYATLKDHHAAPGRDIDAALEESLELVNPVVKEQKQEQLSRYAAQLRQDTQMLASLIPAGQKYLLVGADAWEGEIIPGRRRLSFPSPGGRGDGVSSSPPADDETAIRELEELRRSGASFLVMGQPAFWWLGFYKKLNRHLHNEFRLMLKNNLLLVFDMRK